MINTSVFLDYDIELRINYIYPVLSINIHAQYIRVVVDSSMVREWRFMTGLIHLGRVPSSVNVRRGTLLGYRPIWPSLAHLGGESRARWAVRGHWPHSSALYLMRDPGEYRGPRHDSLSFSAHAWEIINIRVHIRDIYIEYNETYDPSNWKTVH